MSRLDCRETKAAPTHWNICMLHPCAQCYSLRKLTKVDNQFINPVKFWAKFGSMCFRNDMRQSSAKVKELFLRDLFPLPHIILIALSSTTSLRIQWVIDWKTTVSKHIKWHDSTQEVLPSKKAHKQKNYSSSCSLLLYHTDFSHYRVLTLTQPQTEVFHTFLSCLHSCVHVWLVQLVCVKTFHPPIWHPHPSKQNMLRVHTESVLMALSLCRWRVGWSCHSPLSPSSSEALGEESVPQPVDVTSACLETMPRAW